MTGHGVPAGVARGGEPHFGYGSNMSHHALAMKDVFVTSMTRAVLRNWRLVFNLHVPNDPLEPSYANVEPCEGAEVHGVVSVLDSSNVERLDRLEGSGQAYGKVRVTVTTYDGEETQAWMYCCTSEFLEKQPHKMLELKEVPPSRRYLDVLLEGARSSGLKDEYITALAQRPVSPLPKLELSEAALSAAHKRLWSVEEVSSADPAVTALRGLVISLEPEPVFIRKIMGGEDKTLMCASRMPGENPDCAEKLSRAHCEYVNATVASLLGKGCAIVGKTADWERYERVFKERLSRSSPA